MTETALFDDDVPRPPWRPVLRGAWNRCPRCGEGRLLIATLPTVIGEMVLEMQRAKRMRGFGDGDDTEESSRPGAAS